MTRRNDLPPDAADRAIEELMADRTTQPRLQFGLSKLFILTAGIGVLLALWPVAKMVAPEVYMAAFMILIAAASALAALRIK